MLPSVQMSKSLALACALLLRAAASFACATAPPAGEEVRPAEEEALIVWDAAHHVEHFIRQAGFRTTARSFGFLVPTPIKPELAEIDAGIFGQLADQIRPKVRRETSGYTVTCVMMAGDRKAGLALPDVRVLQTAHVAGYDATTLEADDPAALAGWLEERGFARTPALDEWLARYVANHWKITAFVVGGAPDIATRTVKMSFPIDKPFYPYREPKGTTGDRLLRVYFVSTEKTAATLAGGPWIGHVIYAAPIAKLLAFMPDKPIATVFQDTSSTRPGDDELYFAPAADHSEVYQADVVFKQPHEIPAEAIVLAGIVLAVVLVLRRRRS